MSTVYQREQAREQEQEERRRGGEGGRCRKEGVKVPRKGKSRKDG